MAGSLSRWFAGLAGSGRRRDLINRTPEDAKVNTVARYLAQQDVFLDLEVASKRQLFHVIAQHMHREHALSPDDIVLGLSRREQVGSTGLGGGVAIPHTRIAGLDRIYTYYARLKPAIPFDSPDGEPVCDVLALLVPRPATDDHLALLADAMELLSDRRFRNRLHVATSPLEAFEAFREGTRAGAALA
jgi:PTS system nitrogen regulatory IIA component